jgi:hypothetical protein
MTKQAEKQTHTDHPARHWDRTCPACVEQAEKQEPVAWMFQHDETGRMSYVSNDGMNSPEYFLSMNPRYGFVCALYTAPPRKEWVGLTTEEAAICWTNSEVQSWKNIEAKLKEKNT